MNEYTFIYKENNSDDRDIVNYIEIDRLGKLECDHYFPSINLHGSCFSTSFPSSIVDYNNITTILTKEDFIALINYNNAIHDLKYGIVKGDERYLKGIELYKNIEPILDKLKSEENQELFKKVVEDEIEYLKDKFSLDDEEIEEIFNNYTLSYRDRSIVSHIFYDTEECAREYIDSTGMFCEVKHFNIDRYFDYDLFGKDLLEDDSYHELPDGRVVYYMY